MPRGGFLIENYMLGNEGATPDEEVLAPELEAVDTPKSMDDTIRETLQSLREKSPDDDAFKESKEPKERTDTPESPEEKAERIRDVKG